MRQQPLPTDLQLRFIQERPEEWNGSYRLMTYRRLCQIYLRCYNIRLNEPDEDGWDYDSWRDGIIYSRLDRDPELLRRLLDRYFDEPRLTLWERAKQFFYSLGRACS